MKKLMNILIKKNQREHNQVFKLLINFNDTVITVNINNYQVVLL